MFLLSELDDYKQIKTADRGHYYTSGSGIEFLRNEEVYDYDIGVWENAEIWTCSSVLQTIKYHKSVVIYVAKSLQWHKHLFDKKKHLTHKV